MRFNKGIHNILVERGIASENTAMLFMCFYGAIRQTNMATDSFNIYLSPVGVKSLNRFVINWQAGAKLIRLNASTIKKRHDVFIKGNSGLVGSWGSVVAMRRILICRKESNPRSSTLARHSTKEGGPRRV